MAVDSLKQQLPQAQNTMNDAAAERLARFEATNHIADINQQTQVTIANMSTLESKIGQDKADRQQAQAELASAQAQLGNVTPTITGIDDKLTRIRFLEFTAAALASRRSIASS